MEKKNCTQNFLILCPLLKFISRYTWWCRLSGFFSVPTIFTTFSIDCITRRLHGLSLTCLFSKWHILLSYWLSRRKCPFKIFISSQYEILSQLSLNMKCKLQVWSSDLCKILTLSFTLFQLPFHFYLCVLWNKASYALSSQHIKVPFQLL